MTSTEQEEHPRKRVRLDESTPADQTIPNLPLSNRVDSDLAKELRVGITEFVSPDTVGFSGIFKQRYIDFLVNEILPSGKVLHLESLGNGSGSPSVGQKKPQAALETTPAQPEPPIPQHEVQQPEKSSSVSQQNGEPRPEGEVATSEEIETSKIPEQDVSTLHAIFGESITSSILSLYRAVMKNPKRKARDFTPVKSAVLPDKQQRTNAHQAVRRIFSSRLDTTTEGDETIIIRANPPRETKNGSHNGTNNRRIGKLAWDDLGGEYLHFTLYKENKDTMEVVHYIGSQLKTAPRNIQFAGTKDRRGVTVQRISVKRVHAEQLGRIGSTLRNANIGDFKYQKNGLELGDLLGNEFTVTLRDCHFPDEEGLDFLQKLELAKGMVSKAADAFKQNGFINYFGLQRFGSFSSTTDVIGLKMLQGNLKGAVDDILQFSSEALAAAEGKPVSAIVSADDKARAEALNIWKTSGKSGPALQKLPRKFTAESSIIRHLGFIDRKTGEALRRNDFQGALMTIPRNLRLMYVHAYQSLVWNVIAGERWKLSGSKVMEGDLVLVKEHKDKNGAAKDKDEDVVDQAGEVIIRPGAEDSATSAEDAYERARPLSRDEADSGNYSIFDVVLPLPGFDVEYPPNAIGKAYETFMKSEQGGGLDPHDMRRKWKDISLSGGYRRLLGRPGNDVTFEVREYVRDDEHMVETDLEKLQRKEGTTSDNMEVEAPESENEEKKVAAILKFQLGSSQYATMALRELMKAGGVRTFRPEYGGGR